MLSYQSFHSVFSSIFRSCFCKDTDESKDTESNVQFEEDYGMDSDDDYDLDADEDYDLGDDEDDNVEPTNGGDLLNLDLKMNFPNIKSLLASFQVCDSIHKTWWNNNDF